MENNQTKVEWRDVVGYEGIYTVSSNGFIRSGRTRIMKLINTTRGYKCVTLYYGNKDKKGKCRNRKNHYVHRLVAYAFIPTVDGLNDINHKNGIKTDNRVENLEWTNPALNQKHAIDTGLKKPLFRGKNGMTKLTNIDVDYVIKKISCAEATPKQLSELFKVTSSLIRKIYRDKGIINEQI